MARIFISYIRVDKDKVFKIKDQIESALGEKCWIDIDGIEAGDFAQQTLYAIDTATTLLFFYSKESETSQSQRRVLEYAIQNNKHIVLLLIDEIHNESWYYHFLSKCPSIRIDQGIDIENIKIAITQNRHSAEETYVKLPQTEKQEHPHDYSSKKNSTIHNAIHYEFIGISCLFVLLMLFGIILLFQFTNTEGTNTLEDTDPCEVGVNDYGEGDEHDTDSNSLAAPTPFEDDYSDGNEDYGYDTDSNDSIGAEDGNIENYIDSEDLAYFMHITKLSDSDLELEAMRIKHIIDSLEIEGNAEQDLYKYQKYQYLIQEEVEGRKLFTEDTPSHEKGTDNTNYLSYLWLLPVLLLIPVGYYVINKKGKRNSKTIESNNVHNENLPIFAQRKEIKIFIAGSTRLVAERDALRATISKMYNQHKSDNLVVEAYEFDDFSREYVEGGQQKLYDNFIRNEANWVVFITDGTIGDKTIWELENAISVHKEKGHPKILMYSIPQNITTDQKQQMSLFKSILNKEDNYWIDYQDINTIRSTFREHLEWDLINLMKQELRRAV